MLKTLDAICEPGSVINEDCISYNDNYLMVLDGATGLRKGVIPHTDDDAKWFVETLTDYLNKQFSLAIPLPEIMTDAIYYMQNQLTRLGCEKITKVDKPCASVVITRILGDEMELFRLGDCSILVETTNNDYLVFEDSRLSALDQQAIEAMVALHQKENISIIEARPRIQEILIAHRNKKNTPDGYWILGFNTAAIAHASYSRLPLSQIRTLYLMSDGFSAFYEKMQLADGPQDFIRQYQMLGGQKMYTMLREAENADAKCNKHPRFKIKDDASLLVASLCSSSS